MIGVGILCCIALGTYRAKANNMNQEAVIDIALLGVVCGFAGAKVLYVIVEFPEFLKDPLALLGSEGFVVYGGIIAGVAAAICYCRYKKLVFLEYFDLLVPSVAVAQGFGRIGCFLAGCCYGRETDSVIGVVFPPESMALSGVPLLPVQLFSAAGDFLIAVILIIYYKKNTRTGNVGALYLLLYGVGRFAIEFLRMDERGGIGIFSTSQWISFGIVAFAVFMFVRNKRHTEE